MGKVGLPFRMLNELKRVVTAQAGGEACRSGGGRGLLIATRGLPTQG
jgi:hypothetical protein